MTHDALHPTARTQVRRLPARGVYDRAAIDAILDEGIVCHVAFLVEGQPFAIPTAYARSGAHLYIHGSTASRLVRALSVGVDVCVTVTLVDGFVLARSAFHHSMNYRSVVVLGRATLVTHADEKLEALRRLTNHLVPDRWDEVRAPTPQELKATSILRLPIAEASAKVRIGPPVDDEEDYDWPVWAGVVPIVTSAGPLVPDARVRPDVATFELQRLTTVRRVRTAPGPETS